MRTWRKVDGVARSPSVFQTARLLNRYLLKREEHAFAFLPQLLLGRRGPATYMVVYYVVHNGGVDAGVSGARPHEYRHT